MCDDNCANLKPDRMRCEAARTINMAKYIQQHKPNMQIYEKCVPPPPPCISLPEMPVNPTCIRVCNKEEYKLRTCPPKISLPHVPIGHGKLMYAVKAGLLVGAVYFTYSQGVWGDQQDVTECARRWQEYMRSFNTRRPPNFDKCGKVIVKETTDSLIAPLYAIYKELVTTIFAGVVKFPTILKCMYTNYLKALEQKDLEEAKERKIRKKSI
ncbi:uncharacterized protein LOC126375221 [Pectinophora gossypiella]|uniref:uncharacterized protein LOC126375221 n=1 Tax=Pectinophora gossypiella TaxID=13191 RepID=UPI00214E7A82|nr:uncharacterized protein LOC126375221 [Pectinophora gossypiella]